MTNQLSKDSAVGDEGSLNSAMLFVDLVSSSEFASVLSLQEYAAFVESYQSLCLAQCKYYFEVFLGKNLRAGIDYEFHATGDELVVFMHSGRLHNDVYSLTCLAIALKCGWLAAPLNRSRIENGIASAELAAGIHCGAVWGKREENGFSKCGFAINLAKRTESASRDGDRFRIFLSDPAFKQVNRRMRNLLFGARRVLPLKGVVVPIGMHELVDSFMNCEKRLLPESRSMFPAAARLALASNTLDLWVHSCLQVWEEDAEKAVSDERVALCKHTLNIDPRNAAALYFAGQGHRERGELETARLYYEDLVKAWPNFADGWLELGRLSKLQNRLPDARYCILQARRHGVLAQEEELPMDQS